MITLCFRISVVYFSHMSSYAVKLENRGLVHIEGTDRYDFLQGLVTNDIKKLAPGAALYACLLNAQGKFLHDFFILEGEGFILLDCEGGERAQDLYNCLSMYRLRSDVQISVEEKNTVYAVTEEQGSRETEEKTGHFIRDPRHPVLGCRSFEKPEGLEERPFEEWDRRRISLCLPDGSRDLIPKRSTMDEARMDRLGAVDYEKGCYVGQELTARMHYRGLGKKHLYVVASSHPEGAKTPKDLKSREELRCFAQKDTFVDLEVFPQPFAEIRKNGKNIGEMRSSCGDLGLALLKDDAVKQQAPSSG